MIINEIHYLSFVYFRFRNLSKLVAFLVKKFVCLEYICFRNLSKEKIIEYSGYSVFFSYLCTV